MDLQYTSLCARSSNYHQLEAIQPAMNAKILHLTHPANYAQWEMLVVGFFFLPVCSHCVFSFYEKYLLNDSCNYMVVKFC